MAELRGETEAELEHLALARAHGITLQTATLGPGNTFTFVSDFRIIGPGSSANLLIHQVTHATVNANGIVTVEFDRATAECLQG